MLSANVIESVTRFIEIGEIKATLQITLSFGHFQSIQFFFFGKVFCGYLSDSKKLASKGEGSVCTKSKGWGQKQTDLRDELSRAHRDQQVLPVFPGQGCKFTRPKAAEQSLLFGWRNPKAQR